MNAEALLVADLLAIRAEIRNHAGDLPARIDEPAPPTVRSQA